MRRVTALSATTCQNSLKLYHNARLLTPLKRDWLLVSEAESLSVAPIPQDGLRIKLNEGPGDFRVSKI